MGWNVFNITAGHWAFSKDFPTEETARREAARENSIRIDTYEVRWRPHNVRNLDETILENDETIASVELPAMAPGEAAMLCAHHLRLAAACFEAIGDQQATALVNRHLRDTTPASQAGSAWVECINDIYKLLAEQFPDEGDDDGK